MILRLFVCITLCFVFAASGLAQGSSEMEFQVKGVSKLESPEAARTEIQRKASEQAAYQAIVQMIGEKKALENKAQVQSVVRQSAKFMPFIKSGELAQGADGFEMEYSIRVSAQELRQLLMKQGLLSEGDSGWVILPVVTFIDKIKSQQYLWWALGQDQTIQIHYLAKRFENSLREKMLAQGFFSLKPAIMDLQTMLTPDLMTNSLTWDQQRRIAERVKAELIISGEVELVANPQMDQSAKLTVRLRAVNRQTARIVAEVIRQVPVDNLSQSLARNKSPFEDVASDLAAQVFENWRRGVLNAESVQIVVNGQMTPQGLNKFKSWMVDNFRQVKTLKERRFERDRVVFEADVTGALAGVADKVRVTPAKEFTVQISSVAPRELELNWTPVK
jgi:hypothetical protein